MFNTASLCSLLTQTRARKHVLKLTSVPLITWDNYNAVVLKNILAERKEDTAKIIQLIVETRLQAEKIKVSLNSHLIYVIFTKIKAKKTHKTGKHGFHQLVLSIYNST